VLDHTPSTLDEISERQPLSGVTFGQATDRGRLREANEDHLGAAPELGFFVVADGVGGAPAGATAARLATVTMVQSLRAGAGAAMQQDEPSRGPCGAAEMKGPRMIAAALTAHQMIRGFAARHGCVGAATTMAALWVDCHHFHVVHTGDSRVYRLGDAGLEQLTKDHTAMQAHLDAFGPPSEAWARQMSHVVTQVLGGRGGRVPEVPLVSRPRHSRDVFLLCTDGLTKMVSEDAIAIVLWREPSPQRAAELLVALANEAGGLDNVTCIVVHASPAD